MAGTTAKLDPTVMSDWQIAQHAEDNMKTFLQLGHELGIKSSELIPYGHYMGKIDAHAVLERVKGTPTGKYIDVTAITPTPLGEGKTTTVLGLVQGLGALGKKVCGTIRQPSGGPTFNIKGSAAGGGLSQCIPMTPFSLGLTGDIDKINNAHNLAMVALTARMQHERNYDDEKLAQRKLRRLNIDPNRVQIRWVIDFCAQALRNIVIGKGGPTDGFEMNSGFQISVASELMAILAVSRDLADMRERIGQMVVAYDTNGKEITTSDLEVAGAMAAWLIEAIKPNMVQTIEGQPMFVHAGPFANIAIGQSSIIADQLALHLCEFVVTESGFASDIGYEKFWNLKCRYSGTKPDAVVIVATVRALKMHGGGPAVKPGKKLDQAYTQENLALVEKGCENLIAHIDIVRKSGVKPVVCINHFHTDTKDEIKLIRKLSEKHGALFAVSDHWLKGGQGACELAEAVIAACQCENNFKYLYELDMPHKTRVELIAKEIYGAAGVEFSEKALEKLNSYDKDPKTAKLGTCMVKTHLSLSHDPSFKGRPMGWALPVHDAMIFRGAGLVVPIAGDITLMPGTGSDPAFRRIDIDPQTGRVQGMF
ncbi:MAG: formate--tetrahydrofolate ligase [Sedimentisphaerales bacterium]|nr:formate--tetrahydrofolate ligase [Sedimentisphaerales bacterium]